MSTKTGRTASGDTRVMAKAWWRSALPRALPLALSAVVIASLAGCGSTTSTTSTTTGIVQTSAQQPTNTPTPGCVQLVPGATLANGVSGVPGIQLPAGTYISAPTQSGGGAGQYIVQSYTVCFQGAEAQIDGGPSTPSATPTSTIGHLVHDDGWQVNNLFPQGSDAAYLDICSAGGGSNKECLNTSGSPSPFSFLLFDQFAAHNNGYTTFQLQVASIGVPTCSSNPQYFTGTPQYTLYQDGNTVNGGGGPYHFQMPPGTRVSSFQGGGTAGSTYAYYCSAGTQATILSFLKQSMQNVGYTFSTVSSSGFTATLTSSRTYSVEVSVTDPQNYYLRIFVPM